MEVLKVCHAEFANEELTTGKVGASVSIITRGCQR